LIGLAAHGYNAVAIEDLIIQLPGLLPLASLALLPAVLRRRMGNRQALLVAAVAWGVFAVLISETLSLAHQLTPQAVALAWLIAGSAATLTWMRVRRQQPLSPIRLVDSSPIGRVLAAGLALALLIPLVTALVAPPNIWDAMSYHMPRILHWMQNQTLAHFPTHSLRQLHQNPCAELLILQFQILSGGDLLANCPQLLGLLGSTIGVSLIAAQLGASPRGQLLSAVICATLPMAILQASNAQNDLILGFWLVCFVSALLWAMHPGGWLPIALAGASLGLAILTKATAYLFALPFCLVFAVLYLLRHRWRAVPAGLVIAAMVVLLNLGHAARNARLYGTPIGPAREVSTFRTYTYTNDPMSVGGMLSNVARNTAIQLNMPSDAWDHTVRDAVSDLHRLSLFGITLYERDLDDPATTWAGASFAIYRFGWIHPDYAGSPLHIALLAGLIMALPWWWRAAEGRKALAMLLCAGMGVLLFCLVLRWQQWHGRLHLPLLILAAAPMGLLLGLAERRRELPALAGAILMPAAVVLVTSLVRSDLPNWMASTGAAGDSDHLRLGFIAAAAMSGAILGWAWPRAFAPGVAGLLLVIGLVVGIANGAHPWTGPESIFRRTRFEQYFKNAPPGRLDSYQAMRSGLRGVRMNCVGLEAHDDEYEYPLWVLLRELNPLVRVGNIEVSNISREADPGGQAPCVPDIIVVLKADVAQIDVRPGPASLP
jgi:4-amino-4-deoxy-L-arabinose transferase-like glycosyltransferase